MGKKILIVDDDENIVNIMQDMIQAISLNFQIDITTSTKKALSIIKTEKINYLFTDLYMPEISGLSLIKEVATLSSDKIPEKIFIVSGTAEFMPELIDLPLNIISLHKPFEEEEFEKHLKGDI